MEFSSIKRNLWEVIDSIELLTNDEFTMPINCLSNATIGEHIRHIVELYQALLIGYCTGIVDYDNRKRDKVIQSNRMVAAQCLGAIMEQIEQENKDLSLTPTTSQGQLPIATNYFREVLYNFEHCIHHQALIKVALLELNKQNIHENFGVAPSTLRFRKQCVQ